MKTMLSYALLLSGALCLTNCKKGDTGPVGPAGKTSLVRTLAEPAGANCSSGGIKIETGVDTNGNGTLDDGEVAAAQTRYICNGAGGQMNLIKSSIEVAGANCANGGAKIETGVDANGNGTLDDNEIVASLTRYICNGMPGTATLVRTSAEPSGANCTYGGVKFETGADANANGVLDDAEVATTQTRYVCNGAGAIYSNWIDVNANPYTFGPGFPLEDKDFSFRQDIAAPQLTADIADKGVVLVYYKNAQGRIFPVSSSGAWQIPDLFDIDGDGVLDESWRTVYASYTIGQVKMLFNIASKDKNELNGTGAVVRYVFIPGLTEGRLVTDLKSMSYEKLATLYNIRN